jgi:hypothetical protein
MIENSKLRVASKKQQEEEKKKEIEEKIVQKAISIKKKQIKKEEILDEISDDDTPLEKIKSIIKKKPVISKTISIPNIDVPKVIWV